MVTKAREKTVIGRAEVVRFPMLGDARLYARLDTGAKTSSIWATDVTETPDGLAVRFADQSYDIFSHLQVFKHYDRVRVASSMGQVQVRFRVKMPIIIGKRRVLATFTLADRSAQVYPVLIGRNTLMGKFIVDVAKGSPLKQKELERSAELQSRIKEEHI